MFSVPEQDKRLIEAAMTNNIEQVQEALNDGANVNADKTHAGIAGDRNGETALITASAYGHKEIMAMLLEWGSGVNVYDYSGHTALIKASMHGHTEIAAMLLEWGADVNAKDNIASTALIWASVKGHTAIVAMLLENGADVNTKDDKGNTAFIWASRTGHTAIVAILLENGSDVNAKNNDVGGGSKTALHWASWNGHTAIVAMLLENGADVNTKNYKGSTALMWAANMGHQRSGENKKIYTEIVKLLIRYGATIPDNTHDREELLKIKEQIDSRQALTGVAIRLRNTPPTTNKESVIRQVLSPTVRNPEGEIIGQPLADKIKRYMGGKRKTRKHHSKKKKKTRKTRK
jgi:ankyrin repeat protein